MMKTYTNTIVKYRFEIHANCSWPQVSLLHCVLLEICHVTLMPTSCLYKERNCYVQSSLAHGCHRSSI